jgi:opacity protein-like surface antigen
MVSSSCFSYSLSGDFYLSPSVAASFLSIKSNSSISYPSGGIITDTYSITNQVKSASMINLSGGYRFKEQVKNLNFSLGLGFYTNPSRYTYSGQVSETPSGDSSYLLYDNTFRIVTTRVMAEAQVNLTMGKFSPFLNFGIGPTWNRLYDYTEAAVDSLGFVVQQPFQSKTNTNFAYQAGAGLSYSFNLTKTSTYTRPKENVFIGYYYANLGANSFGIRDATYPYPLAIGQLNSQGVYLGYMHLFHKE